MAEENFELFTSLRYDPALLAAPKIAFSHAGWNHENASPLYMLDFHRDRLLRAATHWSWLSAIEKISGEAGLKTLDDYISSILVEQTGEPLKIRVTLTKEGKFGYGIAPTTPRPLASLFPLRLPAPGTVDADLPEDLIVHKEPTWEIILDPGRTGRSEYTHYKTTKRAMYDEARQRAGIKTFPEPREVLIINDKDSTIMEGSITTPYFWRNGRWVTPPVASSYSHDAGSGGQDGTSRRWALERELAVEEEIRVDSVVDGDECWLSSGVRGFMYGKIKRLKQGEP